MDLVTGGAGFIGRHLVRALRNSGRAVRVLDVKAKPADLDAQWLQGSVIDDVLLDRAMEGVERVFHLAAIPHFWCRDKNQHRAVNLDGTEAVLMAARDAGVSRIVHCSTEAILLPESGGQVIDGSRHPRLSAMPGPYTRSKLLAEEAVLAAQDLDVVVVNPTAPIGPGDPSLTPPMRMLYDLLAKRYPAYLECRLNLVDVRDVAMGHILAAEHGRTGQRYVLGGENLTFSRLLQQVNALSGVAVPKRRIPGWLAMLSARAGTWWADRVTKRAPAATPEAISLALASTDLSSALAESELGYRPRPLDVALWDAIADLSARRRSQA